MLKIILVSYFLILLYSTCNTAELKTEKLDGQQKKDNFHFGNSSDDEDVSTKLKEKMENFKKMKEEIKKKKNSTLTTVRTTTTTTTTTVASTTEEEVSEDEDITESPEPMNSNVTEKAKIDDRFIINAPKVCKKDQVLIKGKCRDLETRFDEETTTEEIENVTTTQ